MNILIKHNNKYLVEDNRNSYNLIHIPKYFDDDFSNTSIFITLLLNNLIDKNVFFDDNSWSELFEESFFPEYLKHINASTCYYDLDEVESNTLSKFNIKSDYYKYIDGNNKDSNYIDNFGTYSYQASKSIDLELSDAISKSKKISKNFYPTRGDVALLFSAGKDSTLTALKLMEDGYKLNFIHFDNGFMRDIDKAYLTYSELIMKYSLGFSTSYFDLNIVSRFSELFNNWKSSHGDNLGHETIDSEIRCLSCRSAMYEGILEFCLDHNISYIADGAKIFQKFMLEQTPMIERFERLSNRYNIHSMYPVLSMDDEDVKRELIEFGESSKTWESKCLLGRRAMNKTRSDEDTILNYFDSAIEPTIISNLDKKCKSKVLKRLM